MFLLQFVADSYLNLACVQLEDDMGCYTPNTFQNVKIEVKFQANFQTVSQP